MKLAVATRILYVAATALPGSAQTLVRSISGPTANAQYGRACIRIPDANADGFDDLLVGAPGFNSQRGAIYCLSGAYLAFGSGQQTLWSLAPTVNAGDLFGYAIADVGDCSGDGVHDYMVGEPGYDISGSADVGAVRLVNGASHVAITLTWGFAANCNFGKAIAACKDADSDGYPDVIISGPGPASTNSRVYHLSVGHMFSAAAVSAIASPIYSYVGSDETGAALASGFDLDGDGYDEYVVGLPGASASSGSIILGTTAPTPSGASYSSQIGGERLGSSVDCAHDYDGDGVFDLVVGAPNSTDGSGSQLGRVVVLSGAKLLAHTPQPEIYTLTTLPSGILGSSHFHFGAAVRASDDLNGDGIGEILVGAPDYHSAFGFPTNYGFAALYSGSSGSRVATIFGDANDRFGDALAGALDDLDGDGFKEFVVAGGLSDAAGTDSGVVKCYRLFPIAPATYCTGKVNSLGCTPAIAFSGSPSANPTAPFLITATNVINKKNGLLFYSSAPTAVSFQGGFNCAANPTVRTPPMSSGGAASGTSCTGTYSFDFNNWIVNGWDFALGAGAEIYAQYWSRDPQSPSHTSLSNALRFLINP